MDHDVLQIRVEEGGPRQIARPKKGGAKKIHDGGEDACTSAPVDPIVRFHSELGNVESLLNKYLCLIPAPLLRFRAANANPVGIISC